ncbi:MAG: hypothetical protein M3Y17_15820 [Actinomycetota bacterium]|nr:hypothetical protein [Actinomycetota bacterium]
MSACEPRRIGDCYDRSTAERRKLDACLRHRSWACGITARGQEPPETTPPPPLEAWGAGAGAGVGAGAGEDAAGADGADGVWDWLGDDCGEGAADWGDWLGACKPSWPGLAGAGICCEACTGAGVRVLSATRTAPRARTARPGATADTSAANAAVSAAAAPIVQRRARLTRRNAASR